MIWHVPRLLAPNYVQMQNLNKFIKGVHILQWQQNILHRLFLFVCLLQHVPIKQNDSHHRSQHGFLVPTLPICHMMYTNFQGCPYKSINMTFIHNHILVEMCVMIYLCNSIGKLPFSYFYISQEALTHVKVIIENNLYFNTLFI